MIYKLFKGYFLKKFLSEQNKANQDDLTKYVGTTSDGMKWYMAKTDSALPVQRLREQQKALTLLAAKISPETLEMMCNTALEQIQECVKGKNNWAKVASIIEQIKFRKDFLYDPDLILRVIAIQLIREDEDFNPKEIDMDLQQEKIEQLNKECEMNSEFFFQLSDISKFSDLMNPSEKNWKEYRSHYLKQVKGLEEAFKIYSSEISLTEYIENMNEPTES